MNNEEITQIVKEMQSLTVGSEEYTAHWELLLEQFTPMIRKLTQKSWPQAREDCFNEIVSLMPSIISRFNFKTKFITFFHASVYGEVKTFISWDSIIPRHNMNCANYANRKRENDIPEYRIDFLDSLFTFADGSDENHRQTTQQQQFSGYISTAATQEETAAENEQLELAIIAIKHIRRHKYGETYLDYHLRGMTLSGIGKNIGITREGVRDRIKSVEYYLGPFRKINQSKRSCDV